jgi:osmotically-inducible protein OsmY
MLQKLAGLVSAAGLVMTLACSQTDAGITTNIKAKFAVDDIVKAYQVDVTTNDGVVTLSGDVETSVARNQAVTIARETEGVRNVVDRLRVSQAAATTGLLSREIDDLQAQAERGGTAVRDTAKDAAGRVREAGREAAERTGDAANRAGEAVTEVAITSAVKTKFLADTAVKGLKIDVDTNDGVVTLTGNVSSRAEANRAVILAGNTEGVKSVVNKLRVGG